MDKTPGSAIGRIRWDDKGKVHLYSVDDEWIGSADTYEDIYDLAAEFDVVIVED